MPRVAGMSTPKYRHHRATGLAVTTIGGVDHYLGKWNSRESKEKYGRLIGEWAATGRPAAASGLTVAELCLAYKKYAESYYSPGGMLDNIAVAIRALRLKYGPTPAAEFGPRALKAVRQQFVDEGKARVYCNRLTHLIRRAFKWAAGDELLPTTTWQALAMVEGLRCGHTPAHETNPVRPVDDATIAATIPHLPAIVADMVRLQLLTGARPAEICSLRPCDVDRTGEAWLIRLAAHKTAHKGKVRVIVVGPKGRKVLARYLSRDMEAFCFNPAETVAAQLAVKHAKRQTPISCGNSPGTKRIHRKPKRRAGAKYDTNAFRHAIHRACDLADKAGARGARRYRRTSGLWRGGARTACGTPPPL